MVDRVHSACTLTRVSNPVLQRLTALNPLFFVTVFDIEIMKGCPSYVAVTTESIFREKRELYDVYVDQSSIVIGDSALESILAVTDSDKERFQIIATLDKTFVGTDQTSDYDITRFFIDYNDELFESLSMAAAAGRTLRVADLDEFGLTWQDLPFLRELVHTYELKIDVLSGLC